MTEYIHICSVPIFGKEGALNWTLPSGETLYDQLVDYGWEEAVNKGLLEWDDEDTIKVNVDCQTFKLYLVKEDNNDENDSQA